MAFTSKLSPYPVPSFTHWRWNFPRMQIHDQHRPVFYQTVVSPYTKRVIKLEEKRRAEHAEAQFRAAREALLREQQAKHDDLSRVLSAPDAIRGALTHAIAMNQHALHDLTSATVEALIRHGKVSSLTFAQLLESLAADRVVDMLEVSETRFDRPAAQKRAGDWSGHSRAREAASLLERAATVLPSGVTTQHFNGLMAAYLTCGFTEANRIHTSVYDMMGVRGVHPNATTYLRVMQSLCLTGNPMEAQSIFTFLKEHHTESITIDMYEAMMWGWLMEKDYQRCDELWLEVTTRSNPRPSVRLAEIYIRSILQLAATPVTATTIQFGQTNEVERKRIPGLMQQLKALGIPYTELNTPIWQDVVDALRKYGISKRKFYDFGRSIKQFSFIDHRRVTGVTHDLRELSPVVLAADTVGAIDRNEAMAPFASQDLPSAGPMRNTWETMPLQDVLNHRYVENVNGRSSEKYRDVSTSIHERSPNWMSEVPETRYDKLYAMSNVKLSKMGIRRHLAGDHLNKEEITQRDKRVLSRTMSVARRVRLSVERNRTHRDE